MTVAGPPREDADVESSSAEYARRFEGPVGRWFIEAQTRITLDCLAGLRAGATVLDVGGGHAQVAPPLLDAGFAVTVVGSHPSCGLRLRPWTGTGRCRFDVADLQALPYADASFDAVVCYRLLAHSVDWRGLIAGLCRVARDRVLVDYPSRRSVNIASGALFGVKHSIERGTTRPFVLYRRAEIARAFEANGFSVTMTHPQFLLPMALHRLMRSTLLPRAAEGLARTLGLTAWLGSPIIARADRRPASGGRARG